MYNIYNILWTYAIRDPKVQNYINAIVIILFMYRHTVIAHIHIGTYVSYILIIFLNYYYHVSLKLLLNY